MCTTNCEVDLEDISDTLHAEDVDSNRNRLCRKCTEPAFVVLRKKDPFCKTCFLAYCTHKFRSTLGKSHLIKPKQKILVAFSGGASSTALLHMIQEGFAEEAHKKFLFIPFLLYVDESPYPGWSELEMKEYHKHVLQAMINTGYPCYVSSINMAFRGSFEASSYMKLDDVGAATNFIQETSLASRLLPCLKDITSVTYKEDFLKHARWNVIRAVAVAESMDRIFSGECCTSLATGLLTGMALGRGSQVAQDTAFSDNLRGIPLLRPLREFQSKEVAMYNQFCSLNFCVHPTLTTKLNPCSSLRQVTEAFIAELQTEFPATVSTIFRTGDKLSSTLYKNPHSCLICAAMVDTECSESSAVASLALSEKLSKCQLEEKITNNGNCCGSCEDSCGRNRSLANTDILQQLCYSCRNLVKSMTSTTSLPPELLENAHIFSNREKMKDAIQDFLLEDD